jgi:hypothetical protein
MTGSNIPAVTSVANRSSRDAEPLTECDQLPVSPPPAAAGQGRWVAHSRASAPAWTAATVMTSAAMEWS